jgi:exonuclease VII small subunit
MKGIEIIFRRGRQRHKSRIKGCKRKLFARQEELEQLMKEQSDEEKKEIEKKSK